MNAKKLNDLAKWIVIVLAVAAVFYNTVATTVIARNEIKHLTEKVTKVEEKVDWIVAYLLENKE